MGASHCESGCGVTSSRLDPPHQAAVSRTTGSSLSIGIPAPYPVRVVSPSATIAGDGARYRGTFHAEEPRVPETVPGRRGGSG
eukprot:scaffold559858_cov36-Prasinocladus_malaysianus.AAC.1